MSKKLSVVAVALKTFQDGAVGSAVAGAGAHKGFERAGHVAHARNSGFKVFNMFLRQCFYVGAVAGLVVPQIQQAGISASENPRSRALRMKCRRWRSVSP